MVTLRRFLQFIIVFTLWLIWSAACFGAETAAKGINSITVILSGNSDEYQTVLDSFSDYLAQLGNDNVAITSLSSREFITHKDDPRDFIVAIGTAASRTAITYGGDTPIFSIFIPKQNFLELPVKPETRITAIVIDQPLSRYLELSRIILGQQRKKLGIFYNGQSQIRDLLVKETSARDLEPILEPVDGLITARHITRIINVSDAILLIPGIADIPPQRAKWLLYMAYRDRIPVIAFSETYVKSGALASVSSGPEDIGRQAAEYIRNLLDRPELLKFHRGNSSQINYPTSFSVHVNRKIAEQLGITTLPDTEILEELIGGTARKNGKNSNHAD